MASSSSAAAGSEGSTNSCVRLDGKVLAATIREELKADVDRIASKYGRAPGLATVLVGERQDSAMYVRMKHKACAEAGIQTFDAVLPVDISQEELEAQVQQLNENPAVDGILVQLPLPDHIDEERVLSGISLDKDVDGFHPVNIGRLCMRGRQATFEPCTPRGCIELLKRHGIEIAGKTAVVLGRSNIVGLPVSQMLQSANATVTVVHSRTADPASWVKAADIVVAAIGQPEFVKKEWIKPGAVIVDVGINSIPDETKKSGRRTVGDVEASATEVASAMTPVPGGVGPMTIAMLLSNTVRSADARLQA